ncbi:MAG TPA: DUF1232 domain-containing protein [Cyanophyceae cyanobacterium]
MKVLLQPLYKAYRLILRNPKLRWVAILGSLIYLFSPIDVVTDAIPFVGWIDDGLIATLLVTEVSQILLEQRAARKTQKSSSDAVIAS